MLSGSKTKEGSRLVQDKEDGQQRAESRERTGMIRNQEVGRATRLVLPARWWRNGKELARCSGDLDWDPALLSYQPAN